MGWRREHDRFHRRCRFGERTPRHRCRIRAFAGDHASRRFRTSSGLAGEQPYYIYDYPAEQELEVADHIRLLKTQLETMTPADGGYAPQVLVIDLYDVALEIIDERKLLDRVLGIEESRHTIVSADTRTDKFLSLLDTMIAGDTSKLPDFIRDRYEQAKAEARPTSYSSPGRARCTHTSARTRCSTRCRGASTTSSTHWCCSTPARSREARSPAPPCRCSAVCRETTTTVREACAR